ncbi:radical SAM family heme chaperone HemW [Sphingomonas jatrophae]|uniref:Heme chaperone HemW n=1 Tax=Sphingomonas jatrophae TaxID=1166337 RepID=A0A1I6JHG3_9SPHN|nr:radical SAM family heme chaperone HemW [Sphingomonas jatrophae]SFR78426.1 oxygen-independent coproporphyrinogen-3 oxidase [Sphingomonas jatrophae]
MTAPSVQPEAPLALYIHWPFCVLKCPYCDFNSHVRTSVDQQLWQKSLLADLAYESSMLPGRKLGSIFFGGGTPSLMPPATVAALIEAADARFGLLPGAEITLEANPSSVEAARFADLAAAGVNRVSLGLQALDDTALRFLGRAHGLAEGLAALDTAQASFRRVSFDLIYARPDQSLAAWEAELARALAFGTGHLSLYQLTVEPGTRFATLAAKGLLTIPDEDVAADLFAMTRAMTEAAGLPAYEVSNHARLGEESRHNLVYWRGQDYAGIGPGAHGRRGRVATVRHRKPENWLTRVDAQGHGLQEETLLDSKERATEALMMGLRLTEGADLAAIAATAGAAAPLDETKAARLQSLGLVRREGTRLIVTAAGMPVLNAVIGELLA